MTTEQHLQTLASYPLIIFYDGVCGLCDSSVQFVLKQDKQAIFKFCALQSELAEQLIGKKPTNDSFILLDHGKFYDKSTAALRVLKYLGGWWKLGYGFIIVPVIIRNGVYDFIAKYRYQWFGKFDSCKIPNAEVRSRFLDFI